MREIYIYIILGERVDSNVTTTTTTTTTVVRTAPPPTAATTAQSGVYTPTAGDADPFPGIKGHKRRGELVVVY